MLVPRGVLLPMVEQIDPALVPEFFWRILAMGRPISNPALHPRYLRQLAR